MEHKPQPPRADSGATCRGCAVSVRLAPAEVDRLVREYFALAPDQRQASAETVARRLAVCAACPDLQYGVSCRHCGCLVAIRARVAATRCPSPAGARW